MVGSGGVGIKSMGKYTPQSSLSKTCSYHETKKAKTQFSITLPRGKNEMLA